MESVSSNTGIETGCGPKFGLTLKYFLVISLIPYNGVADDDVWAPLIGTTAKYNGKCNMDLYKQYIQPFYNTIDIDEALTLKAVLNSYLAEKPEMAELSCYGLSNMGEIFMRCESCTSIIDIKFDCCKCLNEEPYVFEKVHNSAICQLKESVLSDPCNYEISKQNREDVSDIFHDSLRKAKNRADYVKAILDYATASGAASNSPTARLHCQTISHNLECKKDGKCGCVYKEPYMKYVSDAKQPYCVGESGAICNIVLRTTVAAFDELVTCAEGLKCQDAVPGLHCPDFYREDCVFDYPYEGENEDMQNKSSQIIFWNIRACGGRWKDKPELVLSHGIRQGLAFQDFLMWLKIVGVDIIWNIVHPGMT